jgi:hypothetical protein
LALAALVVRLVQMVLLAAIHILALRLLTLGMRGLLAAGVVLLERLQPTQQAVGAVVVLGGLVLVVLLP